MYICIYYDIRDKGVFCVPRILLLHFLSSTLFSRACYNVCVYVFVVFMYTVVCGVCVYLSMYLFAFNFHFEMIICSCCWCCGCYFVIFIGYVKCVQWLLMFHADSLSTTHKVFCANIFHFEMDYSSINTAKWEKNTHTKSKTKPMTKKKENKNVTNVQKSWQNFDVQN